MQYRYDSATTSRRRAALEALPLVLLLIAVGAWLLQRPPTLPEFEVGLRPLPAADLSQLQAALPDDYAWPPRDPVPALELARLPSGLGGLAVAEKKRIFFRALLPLVLAENERIRRQRNWLQEQLAVPRLAQDPKLGRRLRRLAHRYGVSGDLDAADVRERLLRRVDVVPPALVLAQAANESGWGSSRFALEANNLFGEWTYHPDQGLVPARRERGSRHFVRVFPDLRAAVRSYLHNLNTSGAYHGLRLRREAMRQAGADLDALQLAEGLERYSARGRAYVREIQAMIRGNGLHRLGPLALGTPG